MRVVRISNTKRVNGDTLISELTLAGVPVGFKGVFVSGTDLCVSLPDVLVGDTQYDATINAVYTAHVAPADKTYDEIVKSDAIDSITKRGDDTARLIRAALRLINASLNQIRQQVSLPTITWQQVEQQLTQMISSGQGDPEITQVKAVPK